MSARFMVTPNFQKDKLFPKTVAQFPKKITSLFLNILWKYNKFILEKVQK